MKKIQNILVPTDFSDNALKVKDLCTLDTQIIEKKETAQAAAQAMQAAKVGSLVVVDALPIGIITDRDIALKVASGRIYKFLTN